MPQRRRSTLRSGLLAAYVSVFVCLTAPAARADYAVLRNGQRLHIAGYERVGDAVRLDLSGGSVTIAATELLSIEPEDVFPPNPPPQVEAPYAEQIRGAAAAYGMDPKLIASVIAVESNFNPRAVSPRSSFGLMQLQPKTAAGLSVRNVFDPQQNIDAGTRYLRQLLDRYRQNLLLALAAYNAGPSRVEQYRGVPPFRETYQYIQRVTERLRANTSSGVGSPSLPSSH